MKRKPTITIGMTTFNSEQFLKESIKSLLCQTWCDFKLIISDDASTDSTEQICNTFVSQDSRIQFIRQNVNIGPLANFSYVLNVSDSEYFMWASHDDLWHPYFIERCIEELEADVNAAFAVTRWIVESRRLPFVFRTKLANMDFVSENDQIRRMLSFTSLPLLSFKDNLTYGVWRREALSRVVRELDGKIKYFSIGGAANEYCLLLYKGTLIKDVYLRKRYKWIPPGHFLNIIVEPLNSLKVSICGGRELYPKYSTQDYLGDLRVVLEMGGCDEAVIEQALNLNRANLVK